MIYNTDYRTLSTFCTAGVFESSLRETYARTSCTLSPPVCAAPGPRPERADDALLPEPPGAPLPVPPRIRSRSASDPITKRLPTSSKTSEAPPGALSCSSTSHDLRRSVYCVMSLVTIRPPVPLTTNRLKCSRRRLRAPNAISVSNCWTLGPLEGNEANARLCNRVRKAQIEAHV